MTPAVGLLLTTCLLMAPPAKEDDPAARSQATLQRVSKLPLEHQRIWLRLVEQRYGWAVLLTLKEEDAKAEQARVAKILRQKTVGWNDLALLLRQLDQREKAAIGRLVRQYRAEVYGTFEKRPGDLVNRQEAWYRIWSLWEKSGSPPEQQDRLMDWLADAIKASGKDSIRPLPPDPKFGDGVELVPEALVKKLTQPATPAAPPAAPNAPADDFVPPPDMQARAPLRLMVPDSRRTIDPEKRPPDAIVALRTEKSGWETLLAEALPAAMPPATVPPLHVFPPVLSDDPQNLTPLPAPPHQAVVVVIPRQALAVAESSREVVAEAAAGGAKPQAVKAGRQPSETPPTRIIEPPPEQSAAGPAPVSGPPRAVAEAQSVASESDLPRKPSTSGGDLALSPHKLDFAPERPRPPAEYQVQRRPLDSDRPPAPSKSSSSPSAPAEQPAQVNIEALGTRIEGINLSLRNLEGELHEKREFTVDQLDSLLSRLDILVLRQKDLTLFRNLISPREQAKVGQIDSSRPLVATMGTRIADVRTRIRENAATPEAERTAALKHLDELSDRLATLTAEK